MRVFFVALLSTFLILMSCNCSPAQTALPLPLPENRMLEGVTEREHRKQQMAYYVERTVSVSHDCTPNKGYVFVGVDNPYTFRDGRGTGVIIKSKDNRSYIYTAEHVVSIERKYRKALSCKIYVNRNENLGNRDTRIEAEILASDSDRDVAILKVDKDFGVNTVMEYKPFVGEPVWAVGYPAQLAARRAKRLSITEGSLATLDVPASNNVSSEGYYYRVTSQIYFGNSGGGIWNADGKLVGIASAMYTKDGVPYEGYYYIKPIVEFDTVLKQEWKYWEIFDS